jgi:hypothetical protein
MDPFIEGNTPGETISITFPYPVDGFQFGFALNSVTPAPVPNSVAVSLFADTAGTIPLGTFTASSMSIAGCPNTLTNLPCFNEGQFVSPLGVGLIGKAVVTFPDPFFSAFGLDNLTYDDYCSLNQDLLFF